MEMMSRIGDMVAWFTTRVRVFGYLTWQLATNRTYRSRFMFWWTIGAGFILVYNAIRVTGDMSSLMLVTYGILTTMAWSGVKMLWRRAKIIHMGSVHGQEWLIRYMSVELPEAENVKFVLHQMVHFWDQHDEWPHLPPLPKFPSVLSTQDD